MSTIIKVTNITNAFSDKVIHEGLNYFVEQGEICAIVGASGSGKTTLLRSILNLHQPSFGSIEVFGKNIANITGEDLISVQKRWGVLFQQGALFSSLTVGENISFPLKEFTNLSKKQRREISELRLHQVGLEPKAIDKYPAELSGGMIKRVALARAIAMEPELLFLDEPTAGLDPNSSEKLEVLILSLRETLGLSIVVVTHDLDTLWHITDRVAFLGDGRVLANLPINELVSQENSLIKSYFAGKRAQERYQQHKN